MKKIFIILCLILISVYVSANECKNNCKWKIINVDLAKTFRDEINKKSSETASFFFSYSSTDIPESYKLNEINKATEKYCDFQILDDLKNLWKLGDIKIKVKECKPEHISQTLNDEYWEYTPDECNICKCKGKLCDCTSMYCNND